jgi:hypothetical protein
MKALSGSTAPQMRAVYTKELRNIPDDEINGFTRFSGRLLSCEVSISSDLDKKEKTALLPRRRPAR